MGKKNKQFMQIDKELLSEKNYTGTRLIEISDERVGVLQKELTALQLEVNPILDKLQENYYSKADVIYAKIQELTKEITPLKEELKALFEANEADTKLIDEKEAEAKLLKDKLQPIILDVVKDQLGEFETAKHTVSKDGKIYVEVFDELEEKVKAIRASKANGTAI